MEGSKISYQEKLIYKTKNIIDELIKRNILELFILVNVKNMLKLIKHSCYYPN